LELSEEIKMGTEYFLLNGGTVQMIGNYLNKSKFYSGRN